MSIIKTDQKTVFSKIPRSGAFSCVMTLYTRSDKEKEYRFYKTSKNRAITVDKQTTVHFIGNEEVTVWEIDQKHKH